MTDDAAVTECYECGKPLDPGEGAERKVPLGADYGHESGAHDPQTVEGARYGMRRLCDACARKADGITVLKYAMVLLLLAGITAAYWHWKHASAPAETAIAVSQPASNDRPAPAPPQAPTQLYPAGAKAPGVPAAPAAPDPNAPYPASPAAPVAPQPAQAAVSPAPAAAPAPPAASGQLYPTDPAIGVPAAPMQGAPAMPVETLSHPQPPAAGRKPVNARLPYGTLGNVVAPEDFSTVAEAAEQAVQYGDSPTPVPWRSPSGQSEGEVHQSGIGADPEGCRQFKVTAMHQDGPHSGYVDLCPGGRFR